MSLQSFIFLGFFFAVCLIYWALPGKIRKYWLLAAGYVFYLSYTPAMIFYLLGITAFSWGMSFAVAKARARGDTKAKLALAAAVAGTVITLAIVKYSGFAIGIINRLLPLAGAEQSFAVIKFTQPIGISFFTFSAVGYLVDVYRGKREAERNPFNYALYLSFFPIVLSGPVERSTNLLRQIDNSAAIRLDTYKLRYGCLTMLYGYFMKLVCADRLSILVNTVFSSPSQQPGCILALGVIGFGIQLYCDFAGISLIAIGAGEVMGFSILKNFNAPYLAVSISDFWRRWHISLTSWFREYIYFPLGGNRKGKMRKHLNVMAIFLISGLWHGAGWTYIIWGGINGLYMIMGDLLMPFRKKAAQLLHMDTENSGNRFFRRVFTFALVTFSWLFFRAESVQQALTIIRRIVLSPQPWVLWNGALLELGLSISDWWVLILALLAVLLLSLTDELGVRNWRERLLSQGYGFRLFIYMALLFAVLIFGMYGASFNATSFIYVDF